MALKIYSSASYNPATGKTIVVIKEADERETVLFNAELDGDHTNTSEAELIKLAVDWFTLKYVKDFSDQLRNDRINEANRVISEVQAQAALTDERASKAEAERNERFEKLEATVAQAVTELTAIFSSRLSEESHEKDEEMV
ncbi:hypothetical protein [Streptococcus acidominimus]|uniref:Uncharacterized protein n=1 Tax=Streptococcus acidominimus TaxID=1326 RepID=A0A1Q8EF50_STRAI|nr:hypothetical protein [Streptococcus acidominimus]OLF50427.1 hypothetical protein BU200_02135 [Streptococcus acidominimus]SUN06349.1 Uncharacterised protein [Streptococcus acidominimus]